MSRPRRGGRDSESRVPWLYAAVRDTTAQSEGLAVVLMMAIVLLGTMAVLLTGGTAIADGRQNVQVSQAEHAMRQLDAGTSSIVFENADHTSVDLGVGTGDGSLSTTDDGWMRVEIQDAETGIVDPTTGVLNVSLGTVVYQNDETAIAYEGGGVWRSDGSASTMLARPEFHYRDGTLTIPIVSITDAGGLTEAVDVVETDPFERWYPNPAEDRPSRPVDVDVFVTVQSEYYEAWGRYFESELDSPVTYDHARKTASVRLVAFPAGFSDHKGIVATSGTGAFTLEGTGAYTDSYDSNTGPYAVSKDTNGDVFAVGVVDLGGDSVVWGNVYSDQTVEVGGHMTLNGDIYVKNASTDFSQVGTTATLNGGIGEIGGVPSIDPIDDYVRDRVEGLSATNDNAATSLIDPGTDSLAMTAGESGTLDAGRYYVTDLTLAGATLTLDTTDGNIVIGVRDYVDLHRSRGQRADIEVVGDGTVSIFLLGENPNPKGNHFQMTQKTSVSVPDNRSPQFSIYGTSTFNAEIKGDRSGSPILFDGLIYAPAGTAGTSTVDISQAELFGSVVTGELTLSQYGAIHYDEALGIIRPPGMKTDARLEYLHVGVHKIAIQSD